MPVKLGFIILSLIGVLRIPEEFYLYKDKASVKIHIVLKYYIFTSNFARIKTYDTVTRIILRPLSLDEVNIAKRNITTGLFGLMIQYIL